ncbi:E3 ubiquitin-protein ligase TRIM56-like [Saccoglossus kowalevskii]|uniref:E3 ubiquitin-protein ligase TRIM33-like n=1 Tax=Saccoglossus kowalevskii TaxID=10224 RepID=A0ABM0LTX6_SACKO|nr:PREDICTED: E3 ubiquitin-protein ligase TRIM33-like [Saccoglossus kowalevskii]
MGNVVSCTVEGGIDLSAIRQQQITQSTLPDKWIECPACFRAFDFPKILPCYHSVCLRCLQMIQGKFNCPLCKTQHEVPSGGLELLPDNRLLNDLIEHSSAEKLLESSRECGVCSGNTAPKSGRSHRGKKPNKFCTICRRALCSDCEDVHKKIPITKAHITMPIVEYRRTILKESPLIKSNYITCHRHPNEILKLYCRDCDYPICDTCVAKDHTDHTREKIGDARARKEAELDLKIKRATDLKTNLDGIMKHLNEESTSLELKVEEVAKQIKTRSHVLVTDCSQVIEKMKKDQSTLFQEISSMFKNRSDASTESQKTLCDSIDKLTKCINAAERLQQDGQGAGFLYMVKQIIQEIKETMENYNFSTGIKDYRFIPNQTDLSQNISADNLGRLVIY